MREDYSPDGNAWSYFPWEQAVSRAYRWNEDGMAGMCDDQQDLCLGLALWNGQDPFLKERAFGLTNSQGNHGEDVKECWWYLDATPTSSWLQWRYHYPQAAFPYEDLVAENGRRGRNDPEYELVDTGIFDAGRYFVVTVTWAKAPARRHPVADRSRERRPGCRPPSTSFPPSGSVTDGAGTSASLALHQVVRPGASGRCKTWPPLRGNGLADPRWRARAGRQARLSRCSVTTTPTHESFGAAPARDYPKDGISDHVVYGTRIGQPCAQRHQSFASLPLGTCAGCEHVRSGCASRKSP